MSQDSKYGPIRKLVRVLARGQAGQWPDTASLGGSKGQRGERKEMAEGKKSPLGLGMRRSGLVWTNTIRAVGMGLGDWD